MSDALKSLLAGALEDGIKKGAVHLVLGLTALMMTFLAVGFLILALYFFFAARTTPALAALYCASIMLLTVGLTVGVAKWATRDKPKEASKLPAIDSTLITSAGAFLKEHPQESVVLAAITGLVWQSSGRERELILEIARASMAGDRPDEGNSEG